MKDEYKVVILLLIVHIVLGMFTLIACSLILNDGSYTFKIEMDNNTRTTLESLKDVDMKKQDFTSYPVSKCELISDTQTIICNNFE